MGTKQDPLLNQPMAPRVPRYAHESLPPPPENPRDVINTLEIRYEKRKRRGVSAISSMPQPSFKKDGIFE